MKRLFILASAAIVALASCSKTQVVYNDAPEEIGFKAVTGVMTKVGEQITTLDGDMGVYAFLNGETTPYFSNVKFTKNGDVWTGNQYWPFADKLDFVVYSPHAASTAYTSQTLTVEASNVGTTDIANQTDYLYGADYFDNSGAGFGNTTSSVSTPLKHALAKVTLNFAGANITVRSVTLVTPCLSGTYEVDYSAATPKANWTTKTSAANVVLSAISDAPLAPALVDNPATPEVVDPVEAQTAAASIMVVPADAASNIIISYQIAGSATTLSKTIELDDSAWDVGVHYIYNITISPNEIKFEPSVNSWDSEVTTPVPVP